MQPRKMRDSGHRDDRRQRSRERRGVAGAKAKEWPNPEWRLTYRTVRSLRKKTGST